MQDSRSIIRSRQIVVFVIDILTLQCNHCVRLLLLYLLGTQIFEHRFHVTVQHF